MRIKNKRLLEEMRSSGRCEWCNLGCARRAPHHLTSVGAGGSDIRVNLIALGGVQTWTCSCHRKVHDGKLDRDSMELVAAKREGLTLEQSKAIRWAILRLPKEPRRAEVEAEVADLDEKVREVVLRELKDAGVMG